MEYFKVAKRNKVKLSAKNASDTPGFCVIINKVLKSNAKLPCFFIRIFLNFMPLIEGGNFL